MKSENPKKILTLYLPLIVAVGIFLIGHSARADWATDVMTGILSIFIWALGVILGLVITCLMVVASYQHFIDSQAVILGWVIVRDICNMFFVVILMIIAFGTILHLEEYNYKKWLPKLILMAILINFSKTICGLLIDVTQVVMLTFVNAFKDIGGGNATQMLGISKIVTMSQEAATDTGFFTVVGAYILGMLYLIVAIVVIGTMLMMLVMRLVMIWIYVVLSPAAYLLAAFPGGQKYASQWWGDFIKNLIVGPVLAFFIWLSLASLGAGNSNNKFVNTLDVQQVERANSSVATYNSKIEAAGRSGDLTMDSSAAGTEASKPSALIQFVVAIGMLVGGLMVSQQIGGAAGSMAGKGMATLQKGQALGMRGLKGVGNFAYHKVGDLRDMASEKMRVDLDVVAAWKRRNEQSAANTQLRKQRIRKGTLEAAEGAEKDGSKPSWLKRKAALLSTGDIAWENAVKGKITAGSPSRAAEALAKITNEETSKAEVQEGIEDIKGETSRTITASEFRAGKKRASGLEETNKKLTTDKEALNKDTHYQELVQRVDNNDYLDEKEQKEYGEKHDKQKHIEDALKANEEEIKYLNTAGITVDEREKDRETVKETRKENKDLDTKRKELLGDKEYKELESEDRHGTISGEDKKKLVEKREEISEIDKKIKKNSETVEELNSKRIVIADGQDPKKSKEVADDARKVTIAAEELKVENFAKEIDRLSTVLQKNKLSEIETARAHIDATMEAEASKKIATFTNPDQLVAIFKEALESKDQGLAAAVYKKLAKTGNYNDANRALNIGTGYEGMIHMAQKLQEDGGFSQQDARGLVAEVGEICKSVNHFEAFGTMTMNKAGQWEETGKDQQEANILSEKSKVQVQQFVRTANRLGQGSYRDGEAHTAANWDISRSTIALYASKDSAYADEMKKTGNINGLMFMGENKDNIKKLKAAGAVQVAKIIEDIMRNAKKSNVANPLRTIKTMSSL